MVATITTPRLMAVGGGALAELPGDVARFGLARPLIVTDPYIRGCGILDRATALLDRATDPLGGLCRHGSGSDDGGRRDRVREFSPRAGSTASSRSAAAARSTPRRE